MSDSITPALTPTSETRWGRKVEHWVGELQAQLVGCQQKGLGLGSPRFYWQLLDSMRDELAHERTLEGFAWEDVDDERAAYHDAVVLARYAQERGDEAERQRLKERAARHVHRADRIAALLPPRTT